jgi:hypothetical protein
LNWILWPTKNAQQNSALRYYTPQTQSPFWLLKPASEHAHVYHLPRLSWSWTVLLPSETHRKPITSITAVLLPFVTNLLTLPRKNSQKLTGSYPTLWCFPRIRNEIDFPLMKPVCVFIFPYPLFV